VRVLFGQPGLSPVYLDKGQAGCFFLSSAAPTASASRRRPTRHRSSAETCNRGWSPRRGPRPDSALKPRRPRASSRRPVEPIPSPRSHHDAIRRLPDRGLSGRRPRPRP
jgi:hypothetical protein